MKSFTERKKFSLRKKYRFFYAPSKKWVQKFVVQSCALHESASVTLTERKKKLGKQAKLKLENGRSCNKQEKVFLFFS